MRRLFGSSILGAIDQAMLSFFNLVVGIAFVRFSSKSEYASYSLLIAAILLIQSVQNALVNSPITTLFPAKSSDATKKEIFASGFILQLLLTAFLAFFGLLAAIVFTSSAITEAIHGGDVAMAALAAVGLIWREYVRGTFYLHRDVLKAVKGDLLYLVFASVSLLILAPQLGFSAALVLFCIGAAGLISSLANTSAQGIHWQLKNSSTRTALSEIIACGRWSLPSVMVSWAYANGFLYAVAYFKGEDSVAEISAARLLLVPISLLVIGWSSVFRPRVSQLLATQQTHAIDRTIQLSAIAFTGISAAYGAAIVFAMPFIDTWLLENRYGDLSPLVIAWTTLFCVTAIRTVGMSAMLASKEAFRPLFFYGCVALLLAIPSVFVACKASSDAMVIYALAATEAVLASIIWFWGWPRIKNSASPRNVAQ